LAVTKAAVDDAAREAISADASGEHARAVRELRRERETRGRVRSGGWARPEGGGGGIRAVARVGEAGIRGRDVYAADWWAGIRVGRGSTDFVGASACGLVVRLLRLGFDLGLGRVI
jgi:hypothetical protein